jgi:hypothetical protein
MDNPTDNPENLSSHSPQFADLNTLQAQVEALGSMVVSVLILLLVLAGTFDLYLMRQIKDTRADLPNLRNYVMQLQRNGAAIDEFARRLGEYGKTHADFGPILTKYHIPPSVMPAAAPATGLPAAPSAIPTVPASSKK